MLRRQEFQVWSLCPAELGWGDEKVVAVMVTLVRGLPAPRGPAPPALVTTTVDFSSFLMVP